MSKNETEQQEQEQKEKQYNVQNLVPLNKRSPEEIKAITSLGGKKSGEKRRLAKDMRESMKVLLEMTATKSKQREVLGDDADLLEDYEITMADLLNLKMLQQAGEGNTKAYEVARDTAGFKPVEQVQMDANIISDQDKMLLDKLAKREGIKPEKPENL